MRGKSLIPLQLLFGLAEAVSLVLSTLEAAAVQNKLI